MVITIRPLKYLVISFILLVLNLLPHQLTSPTFDLIIGGIFLSLNSLVIGNWLFIKNSLICRFLSGLLFIAVLASLIGTVSFYFFNLNPTTYLASLIIITLISLLIISRHPVIIDFAWKFRRFDLRLFFLLISYLAVVAIIGYLLLNSQTSDNIRSPWEVVPPQTFYLYFIATLLLFVIIRFSKTNNSVFLISLHSFLSFSAVWLIYQIGFDYDPFIHRTNVSLILENGTLLPKPFYYIGQYSLIIFLHHLLKISGEYLDKLLVPLTAAIYIPTILYYAFKDNFKAEVKIILLTVLTILIFPFASFISTTPQALANLFSLITILLSLYYVNHPQVSLWPLGLLVVMTLAIHPLAGIPLFFFFVLLTFYQHWKRKFRWPKIIHRSIFWEIFLLGALALPTAFYLNSYTLSQLKVTLNANWLQNIITTVSQTTLTFYYRPFISFLDLVYTWANNIILVIAALALIGLLFVVQHKQLKHYFIYLATFLMLLLNYLLLKGMISFFSLISYEQLIYPRRILEIGFYLLIPFIIIALYLFFKRVLEQKPIFIFFVFILLSLAVTFSFYHSYPRVDKIIEHHGYSTSATDIKTVKFIDEIQKKEPYIVLAAQPVSAAAIKELRFKYYYNDYFFYPVPTGRELYQLYEDLAYGKQKTEDIIATARFLTNVKTIYFVLNSYWFDADKRIEQEKELADKWFAIDGKNFIFKYSD